MTEKLVSNNFLFAFTKDATLDYWKKGDHNYFAYLPDGRKIDFEAWQKLDEKERFDLLCACFSLILQGFQAPEFGLNERMRNLEKQIEMVDAKVNTKCVWKGEE